jgi:WD40 repeat protein
MKTKTIFLIFLIFTICCELAHALPEGAFMRLENGVGGFIYSVSFSPDGKIVAMGFGNKVTLWDATTGEVLRQLQGPKDEPQIMVDFFLPTLFNSIFFSPDGKMLATEGWTGIFLWDVQTGEFLRKIEGYKVFFSPDGKTIASTSVDGKKVILWDKTTGALLRQFDAHTYISFLYFSPDGKTVAGVRQDAFTFLWDTETGEVLRKLEGLGHPIAFSKDGKMLAAGSWNEVVLWDIQTGTLLRRLKGNTFDELVRYVSFSKDGKTIAAALEGFVNHIALLWDVQTGMPLYWLKLPALDVSSISFSLDGRTIASGNVDGTVLLWDWEMIPTRVESNEKQGITWGRMKRTALLQH